MQDSDLPSIDPESDSPQEQKQKLKQATAERAQERQQKQQELLEAIAEDDDAGAERIQTTANLVGDITADVDVKLDGSLTDRFSAIEARADSADEDSMIAVSETADDAAQLLADMLADPDYDKQYFYTVYEREGIDALGVILENVGDAIESERERMTGAADGFRADA